MKAPLVEADPQVVDSLVKKLCDPASNLPDKYRVLFSLRNLAGGDAHEALLKALEDPSDLFRHDVAFCLGQRQDPAAIRALEQLLYDPKQHAMVRHEAAEALGAIGIEECLESLRSFADDGVQEVAETCQLALQRIEHSKQVETLKDESPYQSVDPTPALPSSIPYEELQLILLDEKTPMFKRYQAMFALRNKGGQQAVEILGEAFKCSSALLKHEVAYVLGQMQDPHSVEILCGVLKDSSEHAMVRHEAAEALGSVANTACVELLKEYSKDAEPIVADSCVVALDMLEFEQSGSFSYADLGPGEPACRGQLTAIWWMAFCCCSRGA